MIMRLRAACSGSHLRRLCLCASGHWRYCKTVPVIERQRGGIRADGHPGVSYEQGLQAHACCLPKRAADGAWVGEVSTALGLRAQLWPCLCLQISNVRPSDESWYKVSDYIDLVGIREATRKRGEATYSTVLESMVLFLKSQRESKLSSAKSAPVLAAVPRDDEAQDPRISTNPLKDCDPVFLYAEQQRAKAEMEAAEADRRARRQQEAESEYVAIWVAWLPGGMGTDQACRCCVWLAQVSTRIVGA